MYSSTIYLHNDIHTYTLIYINTYEQLCVSLRFLASLYRFTISVTVIKVPVGDLPPATLEHNEYLLLCSAH